MNYILHFENKAFSPDGKVQMSEAEAKAHNAELAKAQIEEMKASGHAILYMHEKGAKVGTWEGSFKFPAVTRSSFHNMAGKNGRRDVWFTFDGSTWHGVNIGDNDIVRCRRTKA